MSDRQSVLQAVGELPDSATWGEVTDTLLAVLARIGAGAEFARLYRGTLTAEQLAEYISPKAECSLDAVVAELDARNPARASA